MAATVEQLKQITEDSNQFKDVIRALLDPKIKMFFRDDIPSMTQFVKIRHDQLAALRGRVTKQQQAGGGVLSEIELNEAKEELQQLKRSHEDDERELDAIRGEFANTQTDLRHMISQEIERQNSVIQNMLSLLGALKSSALSVEDGKKELLYYRSVDNKVLNLSYRKTLEYTNALAQVAAFIASKEQPPPPQIQPPPIVVPKIQPPPPLEEIPQIVKIKPTSTEGQYLIAGLETITSLMNQNNVDTELMRAAISNFIPHLRNVKNDVESQLKNHNTSVEQLHDAARRANVTILLPRQ